MPNGAKDTGIALQVIGPKQLKYPYHDDANIQAANPISLRLHTWNLALLFFTAAAAAVCFQGIYSYFNPRWKIFVADKAATFIDGLDIRFKDEVKLMLTMVVEEFYAHLKGEDFGSSVIVQQKPSWEILKDPTGESAIIIVLKKTQSCATSKKRVQPLESFRIHCLVHCFAIFCLYLSAGCPGPCSKKHNW